MDDILIIEEQLGHSFKVSIRLPHHIAIEEKEGTINFDLANWESNIISLIKFGTERKVRNVSALINRSSEHYLYLSKLLITHGFEQYASKIEVFRDLQDIKVNTTGYDWRSVGDTTLSEEEFKRLWKLCMSGSENRPSSRTMDEHLDSVKSEMGENWRDSCKTAFVESKPIGISIPHIESGASDEGRLFYFGVLPEKRGKGLGVRIHYQSLILLKQMGAAYYIGSTHETNKTMQKIFFKNSCSIKAQTESYYKYL